MKHWALTRFIERHVMRFRQISSSTHFEMRYNKYM